MAHIMKLLNGDTHTVGDIRDFEELIDKYLGSEARDYFREIIGDYETMSLNYDGLEDENIGLSSAKTDLENKVSELEHQIIDLESKNEKLELQLTDMKEV